MPQAHATLTRWVLHQPARREVVLDRPRTRGSPSAAMQRDDVPVRTMSSARQRVVCLMRDVHAILCSGRRPPRLPWLKPNGPRWLTPAVQPRSGLRATRVGLAHGKRLTADPRRKRGKSDRWWSPDAAWIPAALAVLVRPGGTPPRNASRGSCHHHLATDLAGVKLPLAVAPPHPSCYRLPPGCPNSRWAAASVAGVLEGR